MKVDCYNISDFAKSFLSESIGLLTDEESFDIFTKNKMSNMDIEFKINGVEINFLQVLELLQEEIDRMIEERAKFLIKEKFADLEEDLFEFRDRILNLLTKHKDFER